MCVRLFPEASLRWLGVICHQGESPFRGSKNTHKAQNPMPLQITIFQNKENITVNKEMTRQITYFLTKNI